LKLIPLWLSFLNDGIVYIFDFNWFFDLSFISLDNKLVPWLLEGFLCLKFNVTIGILITFFIKFVEFIFLNSYFFIIGFLLKFIGFFRIGFFSNSVLTIGFLIIFFIKFVEFTFLYSYFFITGFLLKFIGFFRIGFFSNSTFTIGFLIIFFIKFVDLWLLLLLMKDFTFWEFACNNLGFILTFDDFKWDLCLKIFLSDWFLLTANLGLGFILLVIIVFCFCFR
jgi:hypothetical protein